VPGYPGRDRLGGAPVAGRTAGPDNRGRRAGFATMLFVQRIGSVGGAVAFSAAIVAVVAVLWLAMRYSGVVLKVLGASGVELLTRIAGLLLSAIAVQLIVDAVRALIQIGITSVADEKAGN
jgi:multiple antibiotic resistance protein